MIREEIDRETKTSHRSQHKDQLLLRVGRALFIDTVFTGYTVTLGSSEEWDMLPTATVERSSEDWGRDAEVWQQATLSEQTSKVCSCSLFTFIHVDHLALHSYGSQFNNQGRLAYNSR